MAKAAGENIVVKVRRNRRLVEQAYRKLGVVPLHAWGESPMVPHVASVGFKL
jgi:hypothetical protein